jgi:glycosyltransferase involved in cell wall biosynthesis
MKVGIDIRLIGKKQTGSEAVFFNLAKNLAVVDSKNEYKLFTDVTSAAALEKIKTELDIASKDNFEIVSLKANKFSWNFWTLQKYLRKSPVDVYLTQYITPWLVPKKIKIITIIHDISFKVFPEFIKKSDLFFLNWLIPRSLHRAYKILGVSRFTADEIIKHYKVDPKKVDWFHNAISEDYLGQDYSLEKQQSVREKYKLPEKYILYIGTHQPRKNILALVEAFADLSPEMPGIKLVLAGGRGHNTDRRVDAMIEKMSLGEKVILPGFIDEEDKAALMAGAKIFCLPSFYEGFGIPILEAMSVGTPVVASDIAPHREIAGEAVSFFDPYVSGELSQKIKEILSNEVLRKSLIENGRRQVEKFSWRATAEKVKGIFESLG